MYNGIMLSYDKNGSFIGFGIVTQFYSNIIKIRKKIRDKIEER
jgi:hypothetical protein